MAKDSKRKKTTHVYVPPLWDTIGYVTLVITLSILLATVFIIPVVAVVVMHKPITALEVVIPALFAVIPSIVIVITSVDWLFTHHHNYEEEAQNGG